MTALREIAYAKINLALHVRRRRDDGFHDIETVFAFCEDGDVVEGEQADSLSLSVSGPFAGELGRDNLILDAAREIGVDAALKLTKILPVASGIGGGSADAAAALRLLARLSGRPVPSVEVQRRLGADVPACIISETMRGEGVGEALTPVAAVTGTSVLLVNPRVALSTAHVFKAWDGVDRGPLLDWREGRNDLEVAARSVVPEIGTVLHWLKQQRGAETVRMSGSGATCFALFDTLAHRDLASAAVPAHWWNMASRLR